MSRDHGEVAGHLPVLPSGFGPNGYTNAALINIVLLAEGFKANEAAQFRDKCQGFVAWLHAQPWFDVISKAFLFHALTIHSDDSGIDDLRAPNPDDHIQLDTFFDARVGDAFSDRKDLLVYDKGLVRDICFEHIPEWSAAVVLANTSIGVANANIGNRTAIVPVGSSGWESTILHELGHALFGLADEYDSYRGCDVDTDRDERPWWMWLEPDRPNITFETQRDNIKWRHLIRDSVPIPTAENPSCSQCGDYANPLADLGDVPDQAVGLFEGAGYYHCGIFRPAYVCIMNKGNGGFCAVCLEAVHEEVRDIFGDQPAIAIAPRTDFSLQACTGQNDSNVYAFEVGNFGDTRRSVKLDSDHSAVAFTPSNEFDIDPGRFVQCTARLNPTTTAQPDTTAVITLVDETSGESLVDPVSGVISVCDPHPSLELWPPPVTSNTGHVEFGSIPRGHSSFQRLLVQNVATCCSAPLTVNIASAPAYFSIEGGVPYSAQIAAPARGQSRTSHSVWIRCDTDENGPLDNGFGYPMDVAVPELGETYTYNLHVKVVDPPPFDAVLVIDRSGSMDQPVYEGGPRRLDVAFEAADLFTGLLRQNDHVGLVRYNANASQAAGDVLVDMQVAGAPDSGSGRLAVRQHLNDNPQNFAPQGATSLGAGTALGSEVLTNGSTERRAIVLLTDGLANEPPTLLTAALAAAQRSPSQKVYAVAIDTGDISDELNAFMFERRTDDSGNDAGPLGQVVVTGELSGEREFRLHKFYTQVMADESERAFVHDPVDSLYPGEKHITDIWMGEVDYAADFIVSCHPSGVFPKYLGLSVRTPNGTVITPHNAGTLKGVTLMRGDGFGWLCLRCEFAAMDEAPGIGRWRLTVANDSQAALLRYSVMCTADSDFRLQGEVLQTSRLPNHPMEIVIRPSLFDRPVKLDQPVFARIEQPDGYTRLLELSHRDDGSYRQRFNHTALPGGYFVSAEVTVTTPQGVVIPRARYMSGLIVSPKRAGKTRTDQRNDPLPERKLRSQTKVSV